MTLPNAIAFIHKFHPSSICLLFLIGGICAQAHYSFTLLHNVAFFCSFLLVGFLFFKKNHLFFFAITSLYTGMLCYSYKEKQHQDLLNALGNRSYDVIATILDKNKQKNAQKKEIITLQVHELQEKNSTAIHHVNFCCRAYVQQPCELLTVGDTIKLANIFLKQPNNERYGFFLAKEGLITSFFANKCPVFLERPPISLKRWCFEVKTNLMQQLKTKMSNICFSFFNALFLGNRSNTTKYFDTIKEYFKYWGLSHYLARSGLHLIIFLMCWTLLLRLIPVSHTIKSIILVCCCCLYYLFSWTAISFTRAFTTYCAYTVYTLFEVQINPLHLLSLITIGLLVSNPFNLFFLDFQLSFGLTFALACIHGAKYHRP